MECFEHDQIAETNAGKKFSNYQVKVTSIKLNVRKGAGMSHDTVKVISLGGVYTIVGEEKDEAGDTWGLLKSYRAKRDGWINLKFVKRL